VKRMLQLALGLGVSALCVWLSMRDVNVGEVLHELRGASALGFVAAMAVTILGFWLRAVRWRYFVNVGRTLSLDALFSATMIGFMANNVLPFRLGEFVRPWVLARRERLSKTTLLATVVVERAIDMITLLGIFGVSMLVHPIAENTDAGRLVQWGARVLVGLCLALTVFVIAIERSKALAQRVVQAMTSVLPEGARAKVAHMLEQFIAGLGLFRDFGKLLIVFALSVAMFLCFACALGISLVSLGIVLPWYAGLIMLVITAIGIMVPAAPGYIGTLNIACTAGLALFGVGKALSVPFSWFYFFSQWLPITAVGLVFLNREGLSLGSLGQAQGGDEAAAKTSGGADA
jgi:glycosyltransferase 2 family protein